MKQEQKEQFETRSQEAVCRTIQIQALLVELTEEVRPDFLNAANGACLLTEAELGYLDSFYELINISPDNKKTNFTTHIKEVGCHLFNVIEAKEKQVLENVTYKQLNEILTRIQDSGYFEKDVEEEPEIVENCKDEEEENGNIVSNEKNESDETETTETAAEDIIEHFQPLDEQPISVTYSEQEDDEVIMVILVL